MNNRAILISQTETKRNYAAEITTIVMMAVVLVSGIIGAQPLPTEAQSSGSSTDFTAKEIYIRPGPDDGKDTYVSTYDLTKDNTSQTVTDRTFGGDTNLRIESNADYSYTTDNGTKTTAPITGKTMPPNGYAVTNKDSNALLGFNLANKLPAGAQITSATLNLYENADYVGELGQGAPCDWLPWQHKVTALQAGYFADNAYPSCPDAEPRYADSNYHTPIITGAIGQQSKRGRLYRMLQFCSDEACTNANRTFDDYYREQDQYRLTATIYRANRSDWNNNATWQKSNGTDNWSQPGGDADQSLKATLGPVDFVPSSITHRRTADVTALAKDALANRGSQLSMLIKPDASCTFEPHTSFLGLESIYRESGFPPCRFWVGSSNHPRPEFRPMVKLTYTAPKVTACSDQASQSVSIVTAIDTSVSMENRVNGAGSPTRLTVAKRGLRRLAEALKEANAQAGKAIFQAGLVRISDYDQTDVIIDPTSNFDRYISKVDDISIGGVTEIGRGVQQARRSLNQTSGRKVLFVISDGGDNPRSFTWISVPQADLAKAEGTAVYGLAIDNEGVMPTLTSGPADTHYRFLPRARVASMDTMIETMTQEIINEYNPDCNAIVGYKYNDKNQNGKRDTGEEGLGGWKISLQDETGATVGQPYPTEYGSNDGKSAGYFAFKDLDKNKKYKVVEELQSGWRATQNDSLATPSENATRALGNYRPGGGTTDSCTQAGVVCELSGIKFEDTNRNGVRNTGERGLGGWTFELWKQENGEFKLKTTTKSANLFNAGKFTFNDSIFTTYGDGIYKIREVPQEGWRITNPAIENQTFTMPATGRKTDVNFGNGRITDGQVVIGNKDGVPNPLSQTQTNFKVSIPFRVAIEPIEDVVVHEVLDGKNNLTLNSTNGKPVVTLNGQPIAPDKITVDPARPTKAMDISLGKLGVGNYVLSFDTTFGGTSSGTFKIDDISSKIDYFSQPEQGTCNPYTVPLPPGRFVRLATSTRDLSLTLVPALVEASKGQKLTYTLTVKNVGKESIQKGEIIPVTLRSPKRGAGQDMPISSTNPAAKRGDYGLSGRIITWLYENPSELKPGDTLSPFSASYITNLDTSELYRLYGCVDVALDANPSNNCAGSVLRMFDQTSNKNWSDTSSTAVRSFEPGKTMPFRLTLRNTSSQSKTYDLVDQTSFTCVDAPKCNAAATWDGSILEWQLPNGQNWTVSPDKSRLERNNVTLAAGQSIDMRLNALLPDAVALAKIVQDYGNGERCNTFTVKERGGSTVGVQHPICWKYGPINLPLEPVAVTKTLISGNEVGEGDEVTFRIDVKNYENKAQTGKTWYVSDELNSLYDAGYVTQTGHNGCEVIDGNGVVSACRAPGQTGPAINSSNNRELQWQVTSIPANGKVSFLITTRVTATASLSVCPTEASNVAYLSDNQAQPRKWSSGPTAAKIYFGNCIKGNIHARNGTDSSNNTDGLVFNGSDLTIDPSSILSSTGNVACNNTNNSCTLAPWKVPGYDTNESAGIKFSKVVTRMDRNIKRLLERSTTLNANTISGNFNLLTGGKDVVLNPADLAKYPDGRVWVHYGNLTIDTNSTVNFSGRGTIINYGDVTVTGSGAVDYPDQSKNHSFGLIVLPNSGSGGNLIVSGSPQAPRGIKGAYYVPGTADGTPSTGNNSGLINFQSSVVSNRFTVQGLFIARQFSVSRNKFSLEYDSRTTDANTAPPGFTFTGSPGDTQERS